MNPLKRGLKIALAVGVGTLLGVAVAPHPAPAVAACPDIIQHPAHYSRDMSAGEWSRTNRCVMRDGRIVLDHGRYAYDPRTETLRDYGK
jgi:hypothetical protein